MLPPFRGRKLASRAFAVLRHPRRPGCEEEVKFNTLVRLYPLVEWVDVIPVPLLKSTPLKRRILRSRLCLSLAAAQSQTTETTHTTTQTKQHHKKVNQQTDTTTTTTNPPASETHSETTTTTTEPPQL